MNCFVNILKPDNIFCALYFAELGFELKAGKINLTLHPKGKTEGVHSLHFFYLVGSRTPSSGQNKYKLELPVLMIRVLIKKWFE
jgi:hypothetical protein